MLKPCKTFLLLSLFFSSSVFASQRIAVLDFELNDMTELPNIPAELVPQGGFAQQTAAYAQHRLQPVVVWWIALRRIHFTALKLQSRREVSRSKPPHTHNVDYRLSSCGGLPHGESTLQLSYFSPTYSLYPAYRAMPQPIISLILTVYSLFPNVLY